MSPLELVDDRFGELAKRAAGLAASDSAALRERVEALAHAAGAAARMGFRQPAARVAVAWLRSRIWLGSFVAAGVDSAARGSRDAARLGERLGDEQRRARDTQAGGHALIRQPGLGRTPGQMRAPAPARGRLQQYDAALTLAGTGRRTSSRPRTQQAMRLTRSLGGFVASAHRSTCRRRQGASTLVLRVPIGRVQRRWPRSRATARCSRRRSRCRTCSSARIAQSSRIAALKRAITALGARSSGSHLPDRARSARASPVDREQPAGARSRSALAPRVRRAELARVGLTLVDAGSARQALRRAASIARSTTRARCWRASCEILLYALVVAGPLLALGGIAIAVGRTHRRRSDRRLLERT